MDKLDIDKLKNIPTSLSNLISTLDKFDVGKLVYIPVDLSELSDVVKNDVVTKDVYNNNIEDKIPSITNLDTNAALNVKINEVKGEITTMANIGTTALIAVENEIPNVSNLVKHIDYNTKTIAIEIKLSLIMLMIKILLLKNLIS